MSYTLKNIKNNPFGSATESKITSDYGMRKHPVEKIEKMHNGIDMTTGDNVYATADGVVEEVRTNVKGYSDQYIKGNYIVINHGNGIKTIYMHLEYGSIKVKKGQFVKRGTLIAKKGKTGQVSGPHLHYAVMVNKKYVDPKPYLLGEKNLNYITGNYIVEDPRYVRNGAGTEYSIKKVKDLSKDGQKNATSSNKNAPAQYKKGTKFNAKKIIYAKNYSIWAETPSGYVCIESAKGVVYCKKD